LRLVVVSESLAIFFLQYFINVSEQLIFLTIVARSIPVGVVLVNCIVLNSVSASLMINAGVGVVHEPIVMKI
jgi:hypothetical protein